MDGAGRKEIAGDARIEDRNHFEARVPPIYEWGGKLPQGMNEFHDLPACPCGLTLTLSGEVLKDKELFLLGNPGKRKGIGFFEDSGFYADLIFWI